MVRNKQTELADERRSTLLALLWAWRTVPWLARRLRVSERTIFRDLSVLDGAYRIISRKGRAGGIRLKHPEDAG